MSFSQLPAPKKPTKNGAAVTSLGSFLFCDDFSQFLVRTLQHIEFFTHENVFVFKSKVRYFSKIEKKNPNQIPEWPKTANLVDEFGRRCISVLFISERGEQTRWEMALSVCCHFGV